MSDVRLTIPLSEEKVRGLNAGDVVFLDGTVLTARDEAHMRALSLLREGKELPFETDGAVIYHCGPIMRNDGDHYDVVAAGPTTSARMNILEPELLERTGVRAIIGKGGMDAATHRAMMRHGCVYLSYVGGAAVLAAQNLPEVLDVHWLDLGMAEAVWSIRADRFGPLIVSMDAHGRNLYTDVEKEVDRNRSLL